MGVIGQNVTFRTGTKAEYMTIATKNSATLYWLKDTKELYCGEVLFGTGATATESVAGLLSAEDKQKLDVLVAGNENLLSDLQEDLFSCEITEFEVGGINTTTGEETVANARMRTKYTYDLGAIKVVWPDNTFHYRVIYYDKDDQILGDSGVWIQEDSVIRASDKDGAAKARIIFKQRVGSYVYTDETAVLPDGCSISATVGQVRYAELAAEIDNIRNAESDDPSPAVFEEAITDFEVGGIVVTSGLEVPNNARIRSGYHELGQVNINWNSNDFQYIVVFYDREKAILGATEWATDSKVVNPDDMPGAAYVRLLFSKASDSYDYSVSGAAIPDSCTITINDSKHHIYNEARYQYDVPENAGVINMRKRARQLIDLKYTITNTLNVYNNEGEIYHTYGPGGEKSELTGLLYSSPREEELFVPQTVSFHTFMTSSMNPNSYYYTRQSDASRQKLYYGAVCSSFVSYCYGIKDTIPTTFMLEDIEGMTKNRDQSVYGLKLGDLVSKRGDHVAVVTDILRNTNTGEILNVTVSEAWKPFCRAIAWTPEGFEENFLRKGFTVHRWDKLYAVDYEPTPWVHVGSETGEPVYSTHLSPRRGDKANWRWGETVEVDILDQGDYTGWKLYKNDAEFQTGTISGSLLSFPGLAYGSYKLCLTGPSGDSEFVYWITVQVGHYFTTYDGRDLYCEASAHNATPVSINWNYNPEYEAASGKRRASISYAIFRSDKIDVPGEAASGWKDTRKLVIPGERGVYDLRVAYQTEYGLYWGDVATVTALSNPSSAPPDGYTQLDYVDATLAWIDTGLKADGKLGLWAQVSYPRGFGGNPLFYGGGVSERLTYGVQIFRTSAHYGWPGIEPSGQNRFDFSEPLDLTELFEVLQQSSEVTVGDNTASYDGAKTALDAPLLFGNVNENFNPYQTDKVRIYACEIFEEIDGYGEILHRKFTPVQRNADGVVGLYDLMYNEFYPSVGDNAFVGPGE